MSKLKCQINDKAQMTKHGLPFDIWNLAFGLHLPFGF
jgi:hypothetical protein